MRVRGAAVAVLTALAWGAIALPAVGASELDDHGWWWRLQGGTELPPPPWVPEDGLAVAQDVEGPAAIAAVRYELDEDVVTATLTLQVAGEQGGGTAVIRACPARARWRGAQAGTWEHRPSADCEAGQVSGERDDEGETWTFDVGLLVDDGLLNIVLTPGDEVDGPDDAPALPGLPEQQEVQAPPFQVAFEPPDDDSLETGGGSDLGGEVADVDALDVEPGDDGAAESGAPTEEPEQRESARIADPTSFQTAPAAPQPETPSRQDDTPPPDVAAEPERSEGPTALVAPPDEGSQAQRPTAMEPVGFGDDRGRQAAALIALLTAAAAMVLWRDPAALRSGSLPGLRRSLIVNPAVAERSFADPADGQHERRGLGRFVRPRTGEPPALS